MKVIMIKVIVQHLPLEKGLPVLLHLVVWFFSFEAESSYLNGPHEYKKILDIFEGSKAPKCCFIEVYIN